MAEHSFNNQSSKFTFTASNVSKLIGKNIYETSSTALRNEFESPNNDVIRMHIINISGAKNLPNIRKTIQDTKYKIIKNNEDIKAFSEEKVTSPELDNKCNLKIGSISLSEFKNSLPKNAQHSAATMYDEFSKEISTEHYKQKGKVQEKNTLSALYKQFNIECKRKLKGILLNTECAAEDYAPSKSEPPVNTNGFCYILHGYTDAMQIFSDGTKAVVEIKNRMHKLMEPEYDIIQLLCYMVINRCEKGVIVQQLNGNIYPSGPKTFDSLSHLWKIIKTKLDDIVLTINKACNSSKDALMFLQKIYPQMIYPQVTVFSSRFNTIKVHLIHENAKIPTKSTSFSAAYDLYAVEKVHIPSHSRALINTGIQLEMYTENTNIKIYGRIAPRSGLAIKHGIDVGGGVIINQFIYTSLNYLHLFFFFYKSSSNPDGKLLEYVLKFIKINLIIIGANMAGTMFLNFVL
jgi:hypothetical protein